MMSDTHDHPYSAIPPGVDPDWHQLEEFVEQLQAAARAPITAEQFYRQLVEGCTTLLAGAGGFAWVQTERGEWRTAYQLNALHSQTDDRKTQSARLRTLATNTVPWIALPHSRSSQGIENNSEFVLAGFAVPNQQQGMSAQAVVELYLRAGQSPAVQRGWQELLATISEIAVLFHLHDSLRTLTEERGWYDQSLTLLRRVQRATSLQATAMEIVNEGRTFVGAERLSLLLRRGQRWSLVAASGVDRVVKHGDAATNLQQLAKTTADWGEPLEYDEAARDATAEWPPELQTAIDRHVDQAQARKLVAVPIEFDTQVSQQKVNRHPAAVLIAEQFSSEKIDLSRQRMLELTAVCEPALQQAIALDRFPVRTCRQWAERWSHAREKLGLSKLVIICLAVTAMVMSLVLVPCDYEIAAPAMLQPLVERDVFATASGKVAEVRVAHGDQVAVGDVLAVLADPQLELDLQRVLGEIDTTHKRLEAITVARTDRKIREDTTNTQLPLSAEAEQLQKQLANLSTQRDILQNRRAALTLRSPIVGTVLTLDVQQLLQTRPVERGQRLFTVADTTAGWHLLAAVSQDHIGQVVAAQQEITSQLPTRFRLVGETDVTYEGHVTKIATPAVLDPNSLEQDSPTFEVDIAVGDQTLPAARPGMNAQVRIHCGRRSLGYVWLHDVWDTIYSWLVF